MKLKALLLPAMVAALRFQRECPRRPSARPGRALRRRSGPSRSPADGAVVSGYVRVTGFALNGNLVSNVDLYVDGTDEANRVTAPGGANINLPRPDVMQAFPRTPVRRGRPRATRCRSARRTTRTGPTRSTSGSPTSRAAATSWRRARSESTTRRTSPRSASSTSRCRTRRSTPTASSRSPGGRSTTARVDHVDVFIDGPRARRPSRASTAPTSRPTTRRSAAPHAGFVMNIDSTRLTNGVHTVSGQGVDDQGQKGLLGNAPVPGLQQCAEPPAVRRGRVSAPQRDLVRQLLQPRRAARPGGADPRPALHHVRLRLGARHVDRRRARRRLPRLPRAGRRRPQGHPASGRRAAGGSSLLNNALDRLLRLLPARRRASSTRASRSRRTPASSSRSTWATS